MIEGPLKVLVVEDNPGDARLLREALVHQPAPSQVRQAERLSEALAMLADERFDVVLLDLSLPDSQGLATLAAAQALIPSVPIVVLTGLDDDHLAVQAVQQGAQDYLVKGQVEDAVLGRSLRAAVERRRHLAEVEQQVNERTAQLQASMEQMTAANKELEAFSYSVSHDLRAPLRAINGFAQILLEEYAETLPTEARDYLRRIDGNARQMGILIDDLLRFSRLGRQALTPHLLDPTALARAVLADLHGEIGSRQVEVTIGGLPPCQADPALLRQVFVNLLQNALKFTRTRQVAHITLGCCTTAGGETVYYVRDNGVGFDMRYVDKLFGVFQRLHGAAEYEGTGVGLALVQRIIHRHGGRAWAEAEVGRGATFYFTLAGGVDSA